MFERLAVKGEAGRGMRELRGSDNDEWSQRKGRREYIRSVARKINIIISTFDSCCAACVGGG